MGDSLAVQWLGCHTSTPGSLVRELRSHKLRGVAKKKIFLKRKGGCVNGWMDRQTGELTSFLLAPPAGSSRSRHAQRPTVPPSVQGAAWGQAGFWLSEASTPARGWGGAGGHEIRPRVRLAGVLLHSCALPVRRGNVNPGPGAGPGISVFEPQSWKISSPKTSQFTGEQTKAQARKYLEKLGPNPGLPDPSRTVCHSCVCSVSAGCFLWLFPRVLPPRPAVEWEDHSAWFRALQAGDAGVGTVCSPIANQLSLHLLPAQN